MLLALTQLTSLTRIVIKGRRPTEEELQQDGLQAASDALPVDLSGLEPTPTPACRCRPRKGPCSSSSEEGESTVVTEERSAPSTAACRSATASSATVGDSVSAAACSVSGLGSLSVQGPRVCSMWAGVRVLVDVLMGHAKLGA